MIYALHRFLSQGKQGLGEHDYCTNAFRLWLSLVLLQSSAYGLITNGTILCFQLFIGPCCARMTDEEITLSCRELQARTVGRVS